MKSVDLNRGWQLDIDGKTLSVDLPHTWNALDGQSGENGYLRTRGTYSKKLPAEKAACCLKIGAANSKSAVRLNGETLAVHEGGYSAIFVPLTGKLIREENLLEIDADNSPDESVYPTMADFTFYGGLYRGVELLTFPEKHFDVTASGSGPESASLTPTEPASWKTRKSASGRSLRRQPKPERASLLRNTSQSAKGRSISTISGRQRTMPRSISRQ